MSNTNGIVNDYYTRFVVLLLQLRLIVFDYIQLYSIGLLLDCGIPQLRDFPDCLKANILGLVLLFKDLNWSVTKFHVFTIERNQYVSGEQQEINL